MKLISSFKTKKALYEYVRSWLEEMKKPVVIEWGSIEFFFLDELLTRHPHYSEKIQNGLTAFRVVSNPFGSGVHTDLRTTDRDWISFSWVTCCQARSKSARANLMQALRSSIASQIVEQYPPGDSYDCKHCGMTGGLVEVDHVIPFADLYQRFISDHAVMAIPTQFANCPTSYRPIFLGADQSFELAWQRFHFKNAILQVLCLDCHKEKTKQQRRPSP